MSRGLPSRSAVKAFPEETVHEARHRQATTFGLVEECGNEGTRDDRLVAGSLCHQTYMPRDWGVLRPINLRELNARMSSNFNSAQVRMSSDLSLEFGSKAPLRGTPEL